MTNTPTSRHLLALAVLCLCLIRPQLSHAQRWAAMPTAPKQNSAFTFRMGRLVAPAPGVVWGVYGDSGFRYFTTGLYRTGDNGLTWQLEYSSTVSATYNSKSPVDFSFPDANTAWVLTQDVGSGPLNSSLSKVTVGQGGVPVVVAASLPAMFKQIHFFDAATGVAIAVPGPGSTVWQTYRTSSAGVSWTAVPSALPAGFVSGDLENLVSKVAIGPRWWVATATGNVLQTRDGGATWASASTGLGTAISGIVFRDADNGLAYGANRQLARTTDGGLTWAAIPGALPAGVTALTPMPGAARGYLCASGSNGVLSSSTDDGATWQTQFTDNLYFNSLVFGLDGQLWASLASNRNPTVFPGSEVLLRYAGAPLAVKAGKNPTFLAYPNPTAGLVHLPGAQGGTVRVTDAAGRRVSCRRTGDALDFTGVPTGLYFITLTTPAGQVTTQRISVVQ
jgi:photosystem II stability/assembly factor-like uncharacterized protein